MSSASWIEGIAAVISWLAILIIVVVILVSTLRYVVSSITRKQEPSDFKELKISLGKGLLLGLEILVAADVVRTVALEPTLENVAVLGLLVIIRTFLSWSLLLEIESRWPWQKIGAPLEAASEKIES